jgi:hypothetical protein
MKIYLRYHPVIAGTLHGSCKQATTFGLLPFWLDCAYCQVLLGSGRGLKPNGYIVQQPQHHWIRQNGRGLTITTWKLARYREGLAR